MRYTWRITLTVIILIGNGLNDYHLREFSYTTLFSLLFNSAIGWLIGHQIDHYRLSKRELGSTKNVLLDYAHAMDSVVGEAIGIINETGQFEFVNETFANLFGYRKKELLSLNWRNCFAKETAKYLYDTSIPKIMEVGFWKDEAVAVRKDGTTFQVEISCSSIKKSANTICIIRDITAQKNYQEFMKYTAEHNDLTNLPNRRCLLADLSAFEKESTEVALLFIDLDRFKLVNDNLGHEIGDKLLKNVAKRLLSFKNDFVKIYHHGGDEFIIIIQNSNIRHIKNIAAKIIKRIKDPFILDGNEVNITASIGISLFPVHTQHISHLIKKADTAMYYAKLAGKDTFKLFTKELELQLERNSIIEAELRKAIKNNEFFLLYQPQFQLDNYEIMGLEALIRWNHPYLGLVSPEEFIPIAEETGLIVDIGEWVIYEAIKQIRTWLDKGYFFKKVSVNLSPRQFSDKELVPAICSYLHTFNVDPRFLEIEITESVMADPKLTIPILNALKEIGVDISIDDFGTGYSSLNILKDLPIDSLKIDQSFTRDLLSNHKDNLLVMTIIQIGNILDLKVIAEGIETEQQLNHLLLLNCRIGQGYYFSNPVKPSELENRFFLQKSYIHS